MNLHRSIVNFILHLFEETKTFGFVGKSGTGKSHRAKMVAEKYYIDLIIDDGLLIKGDKILAGKSAKQEETSLGAVRTAIFDTAVHRTDVINAIQKENYPRILILGTSVKMIEKIAKRLHLPPPCKYIHIEDIAKTEEISIAQKVRYEEGKHIIPVPAIEITRRYPSIAYSSSKTASVSRNENNPKTYEKTVVTPVFSKNRANKLSDEEFKQIVEDCVGLYDANIKVTAFHIEKHGENYTVDISVKLPENEDIIIDEKQEIRHIVVDSLERYANIRVEKVNVILIKW